MTVAPRADAGQMLARTADGATWTKVRLHPKMYQTTGSTLTPVPVGPGAQAWVLPTGYAQTNWPNTSGAWVSDDGLQWTYVRPPTLP